MNRSFISVTWTPGVEPHHAALLVRTLEDIFDLLRPRFGRPGQFDPLPLVRVFGDWVIPGLPPGTAYRSMEWLTGHAVGDAGDRILTSRFKRLIDLEPWQGTHPHHDLTMTELPLVDDLSGGSTPVVLGYSRRGLVSLISTNAFDGQPEGTLTDLGMRHLVAHYVGQMFDAPDPRRTAGLGTHGGEPYCTNLCALRHTADAEAALAYGREQAGQGVIYCDPCQRDLVARVTSYHLGLN